MNKIRKWFFYAAYILAVTGFFLYLQFPTEAAKSYIMAVANTVDPSLRIAMDTLTLSLPPGLRIADATIYYENQMVFEAERVKVLPQYRSLTRLNTDFRISGAAYGGELTGQLTIAKDNQVNLDTILAGIRLRQFPIVRLLTSSDISGSCSAKIRYQNRPGTGGIFDTDLTISNCSIGLDRQFLNVDALTFNKIEAAVVLEKNRLQINTCRMEGRQGSGEFTGTIQIGSMRQKSRINITGILKPNQAIMAALNRILPRYLFARISSGKKGLKITIRGNLENPDVRFGES